MAFFCHFNMPQGPTVIAGEVRDSAGQPIGGARVQFVEGPVALPDISALTSADGLFRVSAPVHGTYRLQCYADGYESATQSIEIGDSGKAHIAFRMKPESPR